MSICQLNPLIKVKTPLGWGYCYFIIDYTIDINSIWIVRLDLTGQVKHIESNDIVIDSNPMLHQPKIDA